jgi:dTDP-L-rhamnose 4-epimerase
MKVLVTGGSGFIGSHITDLLVDQGHEVRVLDRERTNPVFGVETIQSDINEPGVVERALDQVDAVCHQAARVGLGIDFSDTAAYVADNDLATANLLSASTKVGFTGRLVLASSMVVYGEGLYRCPAHGRLRPGPRLEADLEAGRFEPTCPLCGANVAWELVGEDAELDPRSVYAATKVAQEHLCRLWARETGATVIALRYHNVYGPRLPVNTPYAGVAALFRSSLRDGQAPQVFEDGGQTRDFVHVADVAAANLQALITPAEPGSAEALNVCSGMPVTIAEVAGAMADAFGQAAPRPVITKRYRLGDVRHIVASPELAKQRLGFSARVGLAAGLSELAGERPETG